MMGKAFALKAPKDEKNKLNIEKYINKIDLKFTEIVSALEELNKKFPSTKYKRVETPRVSQLPPGVKIHSTATPY
jgi:hypothetical protein